MLWSMHLLLMLVQFLETKLTSEPKIFIIEKIMKIINDTVAGWLLFEYKIPIRQKNLL